MGRIGERHRKIIHGHGLCSVPMWRMGVPAGFCDEPAYGNRPPDREWRNHASGRVERFDGKYSGYVPALACPAHGGPTLEEYLEGRTVVRFDGPPGPVPGRFVEVERDGRSIRFGQWIQDGDDWLLVLSGGDG